MEKDDRPEKHTGYLLSQVTNMRQRLCNSKLKDIDITYPQFVILSGIWWFNHNHEIINQVKLINFTKMDKSVVSSILKNLEKRKIVIREINDRDTRAKLLRLSEAGLQKLNDASVIVDQIDRLFFDREKYDIDSLNKMLSSLIHENGK